MKVLPKKDPQRKTGRIGSSTTEGPNAFILHKSERSNHPGGALVSRLKGFLRVGNNL